MNKIATLNDNYTDNKIESVNVLLVESMTGTELEYDTLEATINLDAVPTEYKYGRPVLYYHDNALIGKFFMQKCTRVKKDMYSISCVSGIGLLDKSKHYGGLYTTGKDTVSSVVADIIGGLVPYTIDETIANQKVFGWLPIATRRENLHQLLFAMGATIKKDENGDMFITVLSFTTTKNIPDSRIYVGGSVKYPDNVTKVSVLEHAYLDKGTADEQTTLFEGDVVMMGNPFVSPQGKLLTGMLVEFYEPMHDLTIDTGEILESGVNYAILTGGSVTLIGYRYTHTTVERFIGDEAADEDNTVTVTNATLITRANSGNAVDRLYSYYTNAKTIKMDIVAEGERAGDAVSFNDPFDDKQSGLISELYLVGSNILKGSATIIADYAPTWGNDYTDVIVVTSSQSVTLPTYATKCRAVLISGGHGGSRGGKGGTGETASDGYGRGGEAGVAGVAGAGGRVIEPIIGDLCGGMTFDCVIGTGGEGGTEENPAGSAGTDTTMTYTKNGEDVNLTTAKGYPSYSGFQDFLAPVNVYGTYGEDGQAGAKGGGSDGKAGDIVYDGITYKGGEKASNTTEECNDGFRLLHNKPYEFQIVEGWNETNPFDPNLPPMPFPEIAISVDIHGVTKNEDGVAVGTGFTITVDKTAGVYEGGLQFSFYKYNDEDRDPLESYKAVFIEHGDGGWYWYLEDQTFTFTYSAETSAWYEPEFSYLKLVVREFKQNYAGPNIQESKHGEPITLCEVDMSDFANMRQTTHYGYGSGAVVAANGNIGVESTGADGVDATIAGADATIRGSGGNGGNGGSGGGAGGYLDYSNKDLEPIYYDGGVGGEGSDGGNGADGIILIYYARCPSLNIFADETIVIDKDVEAAVFDAVNALSAGRALLTDPSVVVDAYPVSDISGVRKIPIMAQKKMNAVSASVAAADKTMPLITYRGLEGYFRAELKHFHTLLFSRVAGLLSASASVMQSTEIFRIILTANAAAYDAVQMSRSATIQFGRKAGAIYADAVQMAADKAMQIDRTAEPTSADVASAGVDRTITVNSVAWLGCNVFVLADRTITTETVANLTVQEDNWIAPVQTGSDLYIRSVYDAQQSGDNLHIGEMVFTDPVQTGDSLHITSVYAAVQSGSNLHIGKAAFDAPVQTGDGLHITSTYQSYADGDGVYIDMDVYYSPQQSGSNLLITSLESMKGGIG